MPEVTKPIEFGPPLPPEFYNESEADADAHQDYHAQTNRGLYGALSRISYQLDFIAKQTVEQTQHLLAIRIANLKLPEREPQRRGLGFEFDVPDGATLVFKKNEGGSDVSDT